MLNLWKPFWRKSNKKTLELILKSKEDSKRI